MTEEMLLALKNELKDILEDDNFSIIEINKGSLHVLITLQFLLKKMCVKTKGEIKNLTQKCKKFVSGILKKMKDFAFFGYKEKKPAYICDYVKNIEDSGKEIINSLKKKSKELQ